MATSTSDPGSEGTLSVLALLRSLGDVVEIAEEAQDVAAATLGSGAAFTAMVAGMIGESAARLGLSREVAHAFAAEAARASASLISPTLAADADAVATPGGITEPGLQELHDLGVGHAVRRAVDLAVERAGEIARNE